ncbi:hypothetical protein AC094_41570 [Bacteroides fragilis]|uniref:Uncharacterized protein n=1 Tax=Bacteroides fragilis TaxID=817 RepID=A0A853PPN1_BACFG|nr:hypothetical protein M075_4268 [Bacteroides fragilis str. 20793-3]OCR27385.1 hypothetical protein AC094_41570 [Bacteroides fragilis]
MKQTVSIIIAVLKSVYVAIKLYYGNYINYINYINSVCTNFFNKLVHVSSYSLLRGGLTFVTNNI